MQAATIVVSKLLFATTGHQMRCRGREDALHWPPFENFATEVHEITSAHRRTMSLVLKGQNAIRG